MENTTYLYLTYVIFFAGAILFSLLINGLFLKFVRTLGIRNTEETIIRWGSLSKPAIGGISFYMILILSIAAYSVLFKQSGFFINRQISGILAATTLAFLMGLADDAYNTRPWLKFFIQLLCGIVLIYTGTYINLFVDSFVNYALTVLWVVGIMNSVNMLDNMDAITTVVSICVVATCLVLLYLDNQVATIYVFICVGILAALIGFLYYNWYPSKLYMGDTGSQFVGVFLAALGIMFLWNMPDHNGQLIQSKQFLVTLLAFIIPIVDTSTVVFNRLASGRSPFIGGKDHTTHHLFYNGITERRIAVLFGAICTLSAFFIYLIIHVIDSWNYWYIIVFSLYFLAVFGFLFGMTKYKKRAK